MANAKVVDAINNNGTGHSHPQVIFTVNEITFAVIPVNEKGMILAWHARYRLPGASSNAGPQLPSLSNQRRHKNSMRY